MSECRCGKPTRDDAFVCETCMSELHQALGEVPFLDEQLDISNTRQRSTAGHGDSGESGLPWDDAASVAKRALHATLATWVRFCDEDGIRHQSPSSGFPADNAKAMSRWLIWRIDGLGLHELGSDAFDEITNAAAEARRIVFRKPAPKVYLGTCTAIVNLEECGHSVYAVKGGLEGHCTAPDCRAAYDVRGSQERLEELLDSRLCTAAEIAHLSTYLGLHVSRERVRKQINLWHKRERVVSKGLAENGDPRFRYGDVRVLLAATYQQVEDERLGA